MKAWLKALFKGEFFEKIKTEYGFRTLVFSVLSFVMGVLFGIYNGVLGLVGKSIWFGALAAYYVLLACLRGGLLLGRLKESKKSTEERAKSRLNAYMGTGIFLFIINLVLSWAIAQMIFSNEHFVYPGWTIYAFATYAFYKITMAIIHLVKAKRQEDLTVEGIRNINLMDAAVSVLALQTALLNTFDGGETNVSLFNTFTGIAVVLVTLSLGVMMIVKGIQKKES